MQTKNHERLSHCTHMRTLTHEKPTMYTKGTRITLQLQFLLPGFCDPYTSKRKKNPHISTYG